LSRLTVQLRLARADGVLQRAGNSKIIHADQFKVWNKNKSAKPARSGDDVD
jgi:hypothetical protein